jgi:ADP-ribosylglycohydrolase
MRGAGPTTKAAVRRFQATGGLHATDGSSIGAAMRALPFGWATPVAAAAHRRELTIRLSRTTYGAPEAIISACEDSLAANRRTSPPTSHGCPESPCLDQR